MKSRLLSTTRTCIVTLLVPLAVLVLVVSISNAHASITFKFEGELTSVSNPLSGTFSKGDKFLGTYTFDESSTVPHPESFSITTFENSISAMSFATNNYIASATNGDIEQSFQEMKNYSISISPLSGGSIDNYALNSMNVGWVIDPGLAPGQGHFTFATPLPQPLFSRDIPAWVISPFSDFFDADGNLVYSYDRLIGLIENPDHNQPLFHKNGSPAPTNTGSLA